MAPTQRIALQGLSLGTRAPQLALELPANGSTALPSRPGSDKVGRVVMFAQPNCAVCGELASSVEDLPAEWPALEWVWIEGGLRPEFESVPEQGWLTLPETPGLGFAPNPDRVRELAKLPTSHGKGKA